MKATKFQADTSVKISSYVWIRDPTTSTWESYLVRRYPDRSAYWSRLLFVPFKVPLCMACLSTNVQVLPSTRYDKGELKCGGCGLQYGIL